MSPVRDKEVLLYMLNKNLNIKKSHIAQSIELRVAIGDPSLTG